MASRTHKEIEWPEISSTSEDFVKLYLFYFRAITDRVKRRGPTCSGKTLGFFAIAECGGLFQIFIITANGTVAVTPGLRYKRDKNETCETMLLKCTAFNSS